MEAGKCVACGQCVEVCPVGAAKLGQKLCTKQGEISYPKSLLPDTEKWGPDKWAPDYRDHAKINCYDTGTSPCKTACPAHLPVQGYIKMAAEGRYLDALKLIKTENPFPAVCGAICNRRCEDACTRATIDQAVAIDEIKRFIAEQELKENTRFVPLCENHEGKQFTQKIAVIGAGPAGMSAAYYLRTKGYPVTIFEKESRAGGMLMNGIPSFRLEKSVIEAEIDILKQMGIEFRYNVEIGKDITIPELRAQGYQAFYIAIGAQGGRKTGIPGEDAKGVTTGVEFLRSVNLNEDSVHLNGRTVVIGGGNVAIDVARTALRTGSELVSMYCLESEAEMPAARDEVEEAKEEDIQIQCGWGPKEILTENGAVTGIVLKKCISVFDENHRFAPVYDENDCITLECENVLLSIGQTILWGNLLKDTAVELRPNQTAQADPVTYQTAEPDIFVGGDVFTGPKFAIDAIAAGKQGCVSIHRFVHKGHSLTLCRDLRQFVELDKNNLDIEEFDTAKRQIPGKKSGIAKETFRDLRSSLTEEQVKIEAGRCLGCGASVVDENKCIGCGLCTTKCEFDAAFSAKKMAEAYPHGVYVVQNPPQKPLSMQEMDDVYALPYMRTYHPIYEKDGGIPAISEVKFSLISNRGCFGGCNFCALTFHQGRIVQTRSHASILAEAECMIKDKDFKGYIHDVGGPTANFRHPSCQKQLTKGVCMNRQCLFPKPCKNLTVDHKDYLKLLRKLRALPGVKKVFVRSGIRFDYLLEDPDDSFFRELCQYHVSGQLKVAPEHISDNVLKYMGKPPVAVYDRFKDKYRKINEKIGKKQYLVPYLMSSHPGSTLDEAIELAEYCRDLGYMPEQVQDFYPTPSTMSTAMYFTGVDPRTMQPVYVPKKPHEKALQRALIQYRDPKNRALVLEALRRAGRMDLVGYGPACLVRPDKGERQNRPNKKAKPDDGRRSKGSRGKGPAARRY